MTRATKKALQTLSKALQQEPELAQGPSAARDIACCAAVTEFARKLVVVTGDEELVRYALEGARAKLHAEHHDRLMEERRRRRVVSSGKKE